MCLPSALPWILLPRVVPFARMVAFAVANGSVPSAEPTLFRAPAAAQGERSEAASPWTPTGHPPGLALHSLPTAWGYTWSPYGRRKRAQRSPLAGGRMRPVPLPPPRPPAAPVLPRCRGRCGHRRRPARGAAARQGANPTAHAPSPRGPRPVKGPHGTSHKPPRGARRLVEVAVQTPDGGRPTAAGMRECASDARRGREGHAQGAVPTPCG